VGNWSIQEQRFCSLARSWSLLLIMTENRSIIEEVNWRHDLLAEIGGKVANHGVDPATLRDWRIYGGQQGIWVDKQRTAALTADGALV
jgi:hypothetical protein